MRSDTEWPMFACKFLRTSMRANSSLTQPLMDFGNAFTALHRSTCVQAPRFHSHSRPRFVRTQLAEQLDLHESFSYTDKHRVQLHDSTASTCHNFGTEVIWDQKPMLMLPVGGREASRHGRSVHAQ